MEESRWDQALVDMRKELALIKNGSRDISNRLRILQKQAESLKLEYLKYLLEKRRTDAARMRGLALLIRDKKKMGIGLAIAAGGSILMRLLTGDNYAALNAGLSGFDGASQGFGETTWIVSLDRALIVSSFNKNPRKGTWVTLKSLIITLDELKVETLHGEQLGTFNNLLQRLQQPKGKLVSLPI